MLTSIAYARCNLSDVWGLHGLWLDFDNHSYPSFCLKDTCDDLPTLELYDEIQSLYPSCWDDDIMCHEWLKHGTCFEQYMGFTMEEFFNETLIEFELHFKKLPDNVTQYVYELQ